MMAQGMALGGDFWPWRLAPHRPLYEQNSGPLTLDVAQMYRDNVAPDPGSFPADRREQRGTGVFCVRAGPVKACPPKGR